jgi:hypothetical protein
MGSSAPVRHDQTIRSLLCSSCGLPFGSGLALSVGACNPGLGRSSDLCIDLGGTSGDDDGDHAEDHVLGITPLHVQIDREEECNIPGSRLGFVKLAARTRRGA